MPFVKQPKKREPNWKDWDERADKKGVLGTVYSVNGDEYTGEWLKNKKHGKGTYKWKENQCMYDGDWKDDMRDGFGTYIIPLGDGTFRKQYSGGWKENRKHGYGTNFYDDTVFYEGEWFCGRRHGWGRMVYADCTVYEGEWHDDKRSGQGMLRLTDESRYEGSWKNDMKNGDGKFFFYQRGQVLEGVWVNDVARCGEMKDINRETAPDSTLYPIPPVELADPRRVLNEGLKKYVKEDDD